MEKIYIITSCLECPCDSGAACGHPSFERSYPTIPNYPAPLSDWCPLPNGKEVEALRAENKVLKEDLRFWRDQFKNYTKPEPPLFQEGN